MCANTLLAKFFLQKIDRSGDSQSKEDSTKFLPIRTIDSDRKRASFVSRHGLGKGVKLLQQSASFFHGVDTGEVVPPQN